MPRGQEPRARAATPRPMPANPSSDFSQVRREMRIGGPSVRIQYRRREEHMTARTCLSALLSALLLFPASAANTKHINRAIDLLEQGQPVYYTGSHEGTEGS